jgi:hypothetical protein
MVFVRVGRGYMESFLALSTFFCLSTFHAMTIYIGLHLIEIR